ncbi:MAG TPA: GNAT family N-acetyltransferase, partial [Chitinophaga sp.]|uniref:GNAT family N-acetyltransferase n=1 Tax=Chitinophaga sp. TaxID=1869181 RepID=UPI002C0101AD
RGFERSLVEQEIAEQRQWKIIIDGKIACVFVTTFNDPVIWREKDSDPAVYLHRIATNRAFRGQHFVKQIVTWTKAFAAQHNKLYIRMDTGAGNDKLNNYYVSCGFNYLGISVRENSEGLPAHYQQGASSLFEINMDPNSLEYLPPNLPEPVDDGACNHLPGMQLPDLWLSATNGEQVALRQLPGRFVIYCYPMTGAPEIKLPDGWDAIPGARGCTPQACSFRNHYEELRQLNTGVWGMSTQLPEVQKKEKARIHLPFELLSDQQLQFIQALRLPTHEVDGMTLFRRVTLIVEDGVIVKHFYPVFPPDKNADEVLAWLLQSGR